MNVIVPTATISDAAPVGARKVDFSRGQSRTDLSKQWIARPADQKFLSLSDLRDAVAARADRTSEDRIDTRSIEFVAPEVKTKDDLHRLFLGTSKGEIAPTHWSFGQLASLAGAPAGYLRKLPSPIVADALNYGMRYSRAVEQIKTYSTDAELLAATGPDYGRIYDRDVVEAVINVAGNGTGDTRWKVPGTLDWRTGFYDPNTPISIDTTTLYASDRDVFIFLVDDRNPIEVGKLASGEPDLMFRGFYITNSEVGTGALKLAGFYLRAICCNRIMWGVERFEELSMRHSKYAPDRFLEEARPALASYGDGGTKSLIEGVQKAKAAKLADDDAAAVDFLMNRSFSKKRAFEVLEAVEREEQTKARTAWDFAQGITAVARSVPNSDDRVSMETEARKILDKVA